MIRYRFSKMRGSFNSIPRIFF